MYKSFLPIIFALFILSGCIGQKEESVSGKFTFSGTNLSIMVPEGWAKSNILGSQYPLLFTKIHFGIKPNIKLEETLPTYSLQRDLDEYLIKQQQIYPDYKIINRESLQITTGKKIYKVTAKRSNRDNISIIHAVYGLSADQNAYILSATYAEPSKEQFEIIFDKIIEKAEL